MNNFSMNMHLKLLMLKIFDACQSKRYQIKGVCSYYFYSFHVFCASFSEMKGVLTIQLQEQITHRRFAALHQVSTVGHLNAAIFVLNNSLLIEYFNCEVLLELTGEGRKDTSCISFVSLPKRMFIEYPHSVSSPSLPPYKRLKVFRFVYIYLMTALTETTVMKLHSRGWDT